MFPRPPPSPPSPCCFLPTISFSLYWSPAFMMGLPPLIWLLILFWTPLNPVCCCCWCPTRPPSMLPGEVVCCCRCPKGSPPAERSLMLTLPSWFLSKKFIVCVIFVWSWLWILHCRHLDLDLENAKRNFDYKRMCASTAHFIDVSSTTRDSLWPHCW